MTTRMTMDAFIEKSGGFARGYAKDSDQQTPETHAQLIEFVGRKVGISDDKLSIAGLSSWLMSNAVLDGSCSPEVDTDHVEAIVLLADFSMADAFVAELPELPDAVVIPSSNLVRSILANN